MTNLKLITIENFGELQCNFYRNMNDDILLTREQIGTALEYSNPSTAIKNLHRKHKDRLDSLSMKIKLGRLQNEPTSNLMSRKESTIQKEELWRFAVGQDNPKPISSWIGYGISLKNTATKK